MRQFFIQLPVYHFILKVLSQLNAEVLRIFYFFLKILFVSSQVEHGVIPEHEKCQLRKL